MNNTKLKIQILSVLAIAVTATMAWLYLSGKFTEWFAGKANADARASRRYEPPQLVELDGRFGLELSSAAIESLELKPTEAAAARNKLPLPPMIGTVNYDLERLFSIKPLFTGEVAEIMQVDDETEGIKNGSPIYKKRPVKFGDRVKQGKTLVVIWSRDLGEKKAALVDAICSLRLSQETMDRQRELFNEGAIALAALRAAERQVQSDNNAVMTSERTLRIWKLTDPEIKAIKDEANIIHDQKLTRDIVQEVQKWARVERKVPWFDRSEEGKKFIAGVAAAAYVPERELTILEKNTNLTDMVDPANYGTPLFKVADLSRLQIWVHPPEEYLPILRRQLKERALRWKIRFQSESAKMPPVELPVEQISPSLEPNQHTPMLIGYLDNPEYKHLIGQFVTATILIEPPENTVEIPTDAVNPLNGQEFVFVENPKAKNQFLIRRVSVAQSLKKISYVRTKLTPEQDQANAAMKEGGFRIEPLQAGERVVTRGVVELTAALEELRNKKKLSK